MRHQFLREEWQRRWRRRGVTAAAAIALALALAGAGCGASGGPKRHRVLVQIEAQGYLASSSVSSFYLFSAPWIRPTFLQLGTPAARRRRLQTRSFTLTCEPPAGTLPLGARVCQDIARHPRAMLDPGPARSGCFGGDMPELKVVATVSGSKTSFGGRPFCNWPGGTAVAIYWEATQADSSRLDWIEPRLRCDEDPTLLERPTPWASLVACLRGFWTPRNERLIRLAASVPALAYLQPRRLFPHQIGARRCTIPAGGPRMTTLRGLCGVYLKHPRSNPTVNLVETWPRGHNRTARHVWQLTVANGRARLVGERGPLPPQRWR
jgi:hypothetical protein